jgi:hypothetical protein
VIAQIAISAIAIAEIVIANVHRAKRMATLG